MSFVSSLVRLAGLSFVLLGVAPAHAAVPAPNDPRWPDQWWMQNVGQHVIFDAPVGLPGADISALEAWQWTKGAGAPPLAVIDSGIDLTHPDFAGAAWRNPDEIAGNGIDDDANGRVDDIHGWNLRDDNANITDPEGHGTWVASLAVARAGDGIGIAGIAPKYTVMALRVQDDEGYGSHVPVLPALKYAAAEGARVANISLGMRTALAASSLDAAIREVPELLVVAAAGNSGHDNDDPSADEFPCSLTAPNVICVAATDARDELATFSNFGATTVDLAAPGDDMLGASSGNPALYRPTGGYGWSGGTSASAPLVAGTAQLLLAARPDLTVGQLRAALLSSGTRLSSLASITVTGRRLNAAAALEQIPGPPPATSISPRPVAPAPEPPMSNSAPDPDPVSVPRSASAAPSPVATPRAAVPAVVPRVAKPKTATPKRKAKTKKAKARKAKTKRKARKKRATKRRTSVRR